MVLVLVPRCQWTLVNAVGARLGTDLLLVLQIQVRGRDLEPVVPDQPAVAWRRLPPASAAAATGSDCPLLPVLPEPRPTVWHAAGGVSRHCDIMWVATTCLCHGASH